MQFKVTSRHEIFEDHYDNGEGQLVNSFVLDRNLVAESPEDAIREYYRKELLRDFRPENVETEGNVLVDSWLVNEDNMPATPKEFEEFKKGETHLWAENIRLSVYELVPVEIHL